MLKEDFEGHIANRANIATLEEGNRVSITFSDYEAGGKKSSGYIQKVNGSYILGWKAVLQKGNINAGDLIGLQYNSSSNTFKFILVDQGMFLKTIWHNICILCKSESLVFNYRKRIICTTYRLLQVLEMIEAFNLKLISYK